MDNRQALIDRSIAEEIAGPNYRRSGILARKTTLGASMSASGPNSARARSRASSIPPPPDGSVGEAMRPRSESLSRQAVLFSHLREP
jgi:hypothetical protein